MATERARARAATARNPGTSRTPRFASPSLSTTIVATRPAGAPAGPPRPSRSRPASTPHDRHVLPPTPIDCSAPSTRARLAASMTVGGTTVCARSSNASTATESPLASLCTEPDAASIAWRRRAPRIEPDLSMTSERSTGARAAGAPSSPFSSTSRKVDCPGASRSCPTRPSTRTVEPLEKCAPAKGTSSPRGPPVSRSGSGSGRSPPAPPRGATT